MVLERVPAGGVVQPAESVPLVLSNGCPDEKYKVQVQWERGEEETERERERERGEREGGRERGEVSRQEAGVPPYMDY